MHIENSWSGQHPYVWYCGSHTPNEEYEDRALPPAWLSLHDNQWGHISYPYKAHVNFDSDSQSSSSQCQEYQGSSSPLSDREERKDSLTFTPLSGKH